MSIKVNWTLAREKLRHLEKDLVQPRKDTVAVMAKVTALELARTAAPFGTGDAAKKSGEGAVARDILKVYEFPGHAHKDIRPVRAQKAFWKAFKDGDFETAERLLDDFGSNLRGVPLSRFDGGAAHRAARDNRGKVRRNKPVMIVTNQKALLRYIEQTKREVGTGKGGFADIVRAADGRIRGLREQGGITANWITRHGRGMGVAIPGGSDDNPSMRIQNKVRYAREIVSGGQVARAKDEGRRRGVLYMKKRGEAIARKINASH
jgi:hypothetical protein